MDFQAGRLLRGIAYHSVSQYYMVSQNLQERQVLHLSPCHRVPEPQVRRHFPHPHLVPGAGELPFSLYGRMGILGGGAVAGADCQCQDTAFPHDFPGALLGDDGG